MEESCSGKAAPADAATGPSSDEVSRFLDSLDVLKAPGESNLIGVLQQVQEKFGHLPPLALEEIGLRMKIPLSRIYGVVSFYAQFYTTPRGRHTIRTCRGTACHVKGAARILEAVERHLGIEEGETTPDMQFCIETVACLGTCFLAPVMMIDNQYFGDLTPERAEGVLDNYQVKEP